MVGKRSTVIDKGVDEVANFIRNGSITLGAHPYVSSTPVTSLPPDTWSWKGNYFKFDSWPLASWKMTGQWLRSP